jgi:hypothetical protein
MEQTDGRPLDFLPPALRKHVDPASPVPLRMMAAKALVPLAPADMLGALYLLTQDPDENVRTTAAASAEKLPDRILGSALRDESVPAAVLAWALDRLQTNDVYVEMLVLNASTPDEAVSRAAARCSLRSLERRPPVVLQPRGQPGAGGLGVRLLRPERASAERLAADAGSADSHLWRPGGRRGAQPRTHR